MEDKVSALPPVTTDDAEIKVASITFGYKNGDLIRQLKKRGALIGAGEFAKVTEIDAALNQMVREDRADLQQPVCAFVTFTE